VALGMDDVSDHKPLRGEFQPLVPKRTNATHCSCNQSQL
jgi:hypothetical protein